jgi:hypothetical protein
MVLAPWLRCVHDVECFAPDGAVWEDGAGCTLGQNYTGDYTCHLHRGGTSVVSVLMHEVSHHCISIHPSGTSAKTAMLEDQQPDWGFGCLSAAYWASL